MGHIRSTTMLTDPDGTTAFDTSMLNDPLAPQGRSSTCYSCHSQAPPPRTLYPENHRCWRLRWRDCYSDEHYFPTLMASLGKDLETDCVGQLINVDWSRGGAHPRAYLVREVSAARCQPRLLPVRCCGCIAWLASNTFKPVILSLLGEWHNSASGQAADGTLLPGHPSRNSSRCC